MITTSEVLVLLHAVLTFACILRVLYHQKNHGVVVAWLVVLVVAPIVGLIAYLIIGEPRLGRAREKRKQELLQFYQNFVAAPLQDVMPKAELTQPWQALADMACGVTGFPAVAGQQCQWLNDADAMVDAMVVDIDHAQRAVVMMFYIIEPNGNIEKIMAAMVRAAQRGVQCEIMADGVGSAQFFATAWYQRLRKSGVVIHQSLSIGLIKAILVRSDVRNHRKLLVIDEHTAYTGSFNLVDPRYFKQSAGVGQWVDVMLRMQGPVVRYLLAMFYAEVAVENRHSLHDMQQRWRERGDFFAALPPSDAHASSSVLQAMPSSPDQSHFVFYDTLICALYQAQRRIVLTTPYFVPDDALLLALTTAARRGVDVVLIVPAKVDSFLVRYASHAYFRVLLQNQVRIAQFKGGLLHTKSVLIDDEFALFGTVNLDMRSFYLNLELTVALYSPHDIQALSLQQQAYLRQCEFIDAARWQKRSVWRSLLENIVRLMSPLL